MATVKLLLLLAMLPGQHYSMTAPNARPPSGELRKQVGWELVILWLPALLRVRTSVQISILEAAVLTTLLSVFVLVVDTLRMRCGVRGHRLLSPGPLTEYRTLPCPQR
jgi:hypothetical protein